MQSASMGYGEIPAVGGRAGANSPAVRIEQVAAVCYRARGTSIEFLLVRTRKGRWTFPKGGAGEGLTFAQAAALEAFEEAGVHGRIEEASFTRYRRGKSGGEKEAAGIVVHAFLCEVLRLGPTQELNRNRTWFSAEKAKWKLREGRVSDNGADLARVVDCAVARIERLRHRTGAAVDGLRRVQFEARDITGAQKALYLRHIGGKRGSKDSEGIEFAVSAYVREMMGMKARPLLNGSRVVEGNAGAVRKVVQINRARKMGKNG